jgi:hypothetical protein
MTQSARRPPTSARVDWWRRPWGFVLLSLLATLLWALVGWWLPSRLPSLQTDSFGAINALFSGLALAGVIYTLWAQRREQDENAFGARLDSLVSHYAKFGESRHYRDARGLAWCCAQRACSDPEFLAAIRWWWSIPERAGEDPGSQAHVRTLRGVFVLEEGAHEEGQPERLYSWNLALHRLDDLMTFFQVFAYELDICDRCATTREQGDRLRRIVRSMNVYWDEWGPLLRTIVADASPGVLLHGAVPFDLTPNWDSAFDTIDRFFYPEEGWTRV